MESEPEPSHRREEWPLGAGFNPSLCSPSEEPGAEPEEPGAEPEEPGAGPEEPWQEAGSAAESHR